MVIENRNRKRMKLFSWNALTLTSEGFVELLQWAMVQDLDVLFVQSTHWTVSEPWSSHGFHIVPSPELHKAGGGLLTIIRSTFCSMDGISLQDCIPGRLLHVRCHLKHNHIDLLNIYQVPVGVTLTRWNPMKSRLEIWNTLQQLLHQIPVRNTLIIGGDFNTSLAGGPKATPSDADLLRNLIKDFALADLRTRNNVPTYVGPRGSSTIDFIFMRKAQCDKIARQANCLTTFPLCQAREYPDHRPLLCSVPADWKVWIHNQTISNCSASFKQTKALVQAARDNAHGWQTFIHKASELIPRIQPRDPTDLTPKILNLSRTAVQRVDPTMPLWLQPETQSLVARKWRHLHWAKQCSTGLTGLFRRWIHWTKFSKAHKQLQLLGRSKKRDRVRAITDTAARAAERHDSRTLYEAVRSLTPKQLRRSIRFRSQEGYILSPDQELGILQDHFQENFGAEDQHPPSTGVPWKLTADVIEQQLRSISGQKAVAPGTLPSIVLKTLAQPLSQWLEAYLWSNWSQCPLIPQSWKDAHLSLSLLAKRKAQSPADLRPIALTCGLGKATLGAYIQQARDFTLPHILQYPVFAYVPGRGVQEALFLAQSILS